MAAPMPLAPPVMRTTLSLSSRSINAAVSRSSRAYPANFISLFGLRVIRGND